MRIKKSDYVKIPRSRVLIAREETHKGLNWEDTHPTLGEDRLFMPTISTFMKHYCSVLKAYQGKTKLFDGAGNPLPRDEVEELYKRLTSNCWTHLNARFIEASSDNSFAFDAELDRRVKLSGKIKNVSFKVSPLEKFILDDKVLVSLKFNSQGLPTVKSSLEDYEPGKNIYFWKLVKDSVARFVAVSGRAFLDCNRGPLGSSAGLGVRSAYEKI